MPLYEYQCDACGERLERIQKFSDPLLDTCPKCGGKLTKLLSSPAFHLKGSGWYATDYARKSESADKGDTDTKEPGKGKDGAKEGSTSEAATSSESATASKSETPASESKSTEKPAAKDPAPKS